MNCRPLRIHHTSSGRETQPLLVERRQRLARGLRQPVSLGLRLAAAVKQTAEIGLAEQIDLRVAAAHDRDVGYYRIEQVRGARGVALRVSRAGFDQPAAYRCPAPKRLGVVAPGAL